MRFLNLPSSVQVKVLHKVPVIDLFNLAQCSKRVYNSVKISSSSQDRTLSFDVWFMDVTEIDLCNNVTGYSEAHWKFYPRRSIRGITLEPQTSYTINGIAETVDFSLDPYNVMCSKTRSKKVIFKFIEHIIDLFNPTSFIWTCKPMKMDLVKMLTKLEAYKTMSSSVHMTAGMVTPEEMNMMMDTNAKKWMIGCHPGYHFVPDKKISPDSLGIFQGSWLNRDHLLNLNCKTVDLNGCRLTNEDYHSFISNWLNGRNTKLEHFSGCGKFYEEDDILYDLNQIVRGLPYFLGSPKRREATEYRCFNSSDPIPFEHGFDFRRETDGMLATAMVIRSEEVKSGIFVFVVWHHFDQFVGGPFMIQ